MVFVRKRKWIFYTVLGTSFLSAILMMILYTPGGDPTRVYYGTDTRLFLYGWEVRLRLFGQVRV